MSDYPVVRTNLKNPLNGFSYGSHLKIARFLRSIGNLSLSVKSNITGIRDKVAVEIFYIGIISL